MATRATLPLPTTPRLPILPGMTHCNILGSSHLAAVVAEFGR
jgi:hypothetical protein